MLSNAYLIMWIIWTIILLIFYHKAFTVYYFDLGRGFVKELLVAGILGLVMTAITLNWWWISAIIIIVIGIIVMGNANSKAPLIIALILAIVVAILGISLRSDMKENSSESAISIQAIREEIV